eukprot:364943-Chlamydomonas_euryale.AAC.15
MRGSMIKIRGSGTNWICLCCTQQAIKDNLQGQHIPKWRVDRGQSPAKPRQTPPHDPPSCHPRFLLLLFFRKQHPRGAVEDATCIHEEAAPCTRGPRWAAQLSPQDVDRIASSQLGKGHSRWESEASRSTLDNASGVVNKGGGRGTQDNHTPALTGRSMCASMSLQIQRWPTQLVGGWGDFVT